MSILWFIILIGILIFSHELGHFLFAKLFRVKVLTFSLGFGTPIQLGKFKLSYKPGETEYRLAWFPIGGFVRMLGEDPSEEVLPEDRKRAFSTQPTWARFLIILGGPLFSVLLAIPLYFILALSSTMAPAPVVGRVIPGSPAEQVGIQPGDKILKVGQSSMETWTDIDQAVQDSEGQPLSLTLERRGQSISLEVTPYEKLDEQGLYLFGMEWDLGIRHWRQSNVVGVVSPDSPAGRVGVNSINAVVELAGIRVNNWDDIQQILEGNGLHLLPITVVKQTKIKIGAVVFEVPVPIQTFLIPEPSSAAPPYAYTTLAAYTGLESMELLVEDVLPDKPAQKQGVEAGDKIVAVFDQPISDWEQFSRVIVKNQNNFIPIEIRHQGSIRHVEFKPEILEEKDEFKNTIRLPGFGVKKYPMEIARVAGKYVPRKDRLLYSLKMSFGYTLDTIYRNIQGFVIMFQGKVKFSEALGGPLSIWHMAKMTAEKGWRDFLQLMAFITVLLGLINLLPIPILDGGHIAFIVVEVIRRRPVSIKVRMVANYVGFVLLMGLMLFAIRNDIHRIW